MGIIYRNGDILEAFNNSEIDILAHGCNCSGGFGSGVAGQIAKRYVIARVEYLKAFRKGLCTLGWVQMIPVEDKIIANCMTQQNYGRNKGTVYVSYISIIKCMNFLKRNTDSKKIGIPKIGAGLAGGDWNIIEKDIMTIFHDRDIYVYIL